MCDGAAHRCSSAHLNEPAEWREACIASPRGRTDPVAFCPAFRAVSARHARRWLRRALPLVSFVDPDDLYEASAFTQLADALDACPQAVMAYTDEALTDEDGRDIAVRRLACQLATRQQRQPDARPDRDATICRGSRAQGNHRPQQLRRLVADPARSKRGGVLYLPSLGVIGDNTRSKATEPAIGSSPAYSPSIGISGDKPCHRPTRTLDSTTAGRSAKVAGTPAWTPTSKRLGAVVGLSVKDRDLTTPPASPANGDRWHHSCGCHGRVGRQNQPDRGAHCRCLGYHSPKIGWLCYIEDEAKLSAYKSTPAGAQASPSDFPSSYHRSPRQMFTTGRVSHFWRPL